MRVICDARDAARRMLFAALVVVLLTLIPAARGFAQTVAGTISTATGAVQVQRGATVTGVTPGTAVNVGDRVITGPGGHAVVTLTDGSQLELGESSNLVIDNHTLAPAGGRAATQVSLFGGVLRSVVSAAGGTPNFEVHTPNAVAAVRGTRFDTAYSEGEARPTYGDCRKFSDVVVYEGVVALRNGAAGGGGGIDIPAGYEATVPCDVTATLPGPIGMTGARGFAGILAANPAVVPPPGCPICPVMPPTQPPPLPPAPPPPPTIP